jgi:hypothetical protein
MKAVARIYWTFFTAFKRQRWLGALGLVMLGIGVFLGLVDILTGSALARVPFGIVMFAICVFIPTAFAAGGTLRALAVPRAHSLLPHFRVRVLLAVALFVGSIALFLYATWAGFALLAGEGASEGGLPLAAIKTIYAIGALTAAVLSAFVITGQPNWGWLGFPLLIAVFSWVDADGPQLLTAAGVSLPWIVGVASLAAWIAFAVWYLRARRIRPVLLITDTHGWTETWRRRADRQQKRWPASLSRGSAMGILLWSGRVQPVLPRQLLNAAALGAFLSIIAPLLRYLPGQTRMPPPFTSFVWPFYAMLFSSFAAYFIVQGSRRAWLRVPGQRVRVLRAVEWAMARFYLRAVMCITALVLARVLVFEAPLSEAAWGFALMASAVLYSVCMSLASVRTALPLLFGLFGMLVVQAVLLGMEQRLTDPPQPGALLGVQLAAAAVLRVVAELRWRNIDWLRLRPMRLGRSAVR